MVNNIMLSQAMIAFSEAVTLGESLGLPKGLLLDTLLTSPVSAPFLALKRPKIEGGVFDVEFPLQWAHKDLQLAADTAYETGVAMPLANAAKEIYALAIKIGLGEQDFSAVYKLLSK
jgi:3-hydroxyisobutyrate dehydrogenase/glyoxylate/succinic semialdehyde reductase